MPGTTAPLLLPYPLASEPLAGAAGAIQNLANATDDLIVADRARLDAIEYTLGPTAPSTVGINMAAGATRCDRRGRTVTMTVDGLIATAAVGAGANLCIVPVGFRPPAGRIYRGVLVNFTTGVANIAQINDAGVLNVHLALANGQALYGQMVWPCAL